MTFGNTLDILKNKPGQVKIWELDRLLLDDYQLTYRFRHYITGRLQLFLHMAAGDMGNPAYDGVYFFNEGYYNEYYNEYFDGYSDYYGAYYDYGINDLYSYLNELMAENGTETPLPATDPEALAAMGFSEEEIKELHRMAEEHESGWPLTESVSLSEEEKRKIIQLFHESIKGDQNLLYSISNSGQVLYTNWELPSSADGASTSTGQSGTAGGINTHSGILTAPEGYNFLLFFDGKKVQIIKDGVEVDVYGDGIYRDDSDWYVPGYQNFQANEDLKDISICIAAAKDPILYTEGTYKRGYRQLENALYWIQYNLLASRAQILQSLINLFFGIGLLLLSFLCRKSRKEALCCIARFQNRIWIEGKALLLLAILYLLHLDLYKLLDSSGCLMELKYAYEGDYGYHPEMLRYLSREFFELVPSLTWLILFWIVYLIWNDIKHNKKIWRHGLIHKLYRTFSARELHLPLSRRMAKRNMASFLSAAVCGTALLGISLLGLSCLLPDWAAAIMLLSVLALFLAVSCLIGRKNMETAADVEVLSKRISDIRNGDYGAAPGNADLKGREEEYSDRDLADVMAQLEDIRHGMKRAVDEQMKSERMKVELIANVSHDIKTPLTSIISYVQFLKEEKELPEHARDYVAILDEKSQRLNNMIQDVFAVSKAASGALPMNMELLDFGKLLRQTMADMQEEIDQSSVAFRTEIPNEPVMIKADGQRLYRVFQNLFQNALKYSLDGSRVYVALKTEKGTAVASVKNASSLELDKSKDFTERFTRGDQSRTDGGSGLGLSIAQSFTEACGGAFHWETDADLFVVTVSFKTAQS